MAENNAASQKSDVESTQAERALDESENGYRLLFENLSEMVAIEEIVRDAEGNAVDRVFREVNPAFEAGTGISNEQAVGRSVAQLWDTQTAPQPAPQTYSKVVETGQPIRFEIHAPRLDRYFSVSAFPLGGDLLATLFTDITERKHSEQALQRYRLLFKHARDIILFIRNDGQILEANTAAVEAYGREEQELLSMSIYDLRRLEEGLTVAQQMERADELGILFETVHHRKDGSGFPVEVSSRGIDIAGERVLLSIIRDIGERKKAEEALRQNEAFVRAVLDSLQSNIAILDEQGIIQYTNRAWRDFAVENDCEMDPAMIGVNYLSVCDCEGFDADIACAAKQGIEDLIAGRRDQFALEYPCNSPDKERWFYMRANRFATDGLNVVVSHENITESKQATDRLDAERRRLRAVLDSLPVGVLIADASGVIVEVNSQVEAIWKERPLWREAEDYAKYKGWWSETGKQIEADEWALARALRKGEISVGEVVEIERSDGTRATVLNSAAPVRDAEGNVTGAVGAVEDITELTMLRQALERSLEETRRESERVAALAAVAEAGISTLDLTDLLDTFARKIVEGMTANSGHILLLDVDTGRFTAEAQYNVPEPVQFETGADEGFIGRINLERRSVYVADAQQDPLVTDPNVKRTGVRSLLGTPLIVRDNVIGVVYVDTLEVREFSPDDIRLLEAMAARIASGLDNARLYKALMESRKQTEETLDKERHFSHLLQRALLPGLPSLGPCYHVAVEYVPAFAGREIGGDFYDVFRIDDQRAGLMIGDVSGKGLEAASLAATTRSTIHAFVHETGSARQAMWLANKVLYAQDVELDSFVTVFLVVLDLDSGDFCYACAGHPPAVICRAGGAIEFLSEADIPIGMMESLRHVEAKSRLKPGDKIVMYTDGITEARCGSEFFDTEGLCGAMQQCARVSPRELVDGLLAAAARWAGGRLTDDAVVLCVERLAQL